MIISDIFANVITQVLNQFIKKLQSSILRSIRPYHLTSLQDAVTFARDFESAEQKANHTQAINLAINGTSDIDTEITQLSEKLTQKIERFLAGTTGTYQPPQWKENNNNNPISATTTTAKNLDTLLMTAKKRSWTKIKETHTSNPDIKSTAPIYTTSPVHSTTVPELLSTTTNDTSNPSLSNFPLHGLSRPIPRSPAQSRPTPTGYPNQASYLGLIEDQANKSNISPATITENTTLATIFPFDIDNLNTHSLFSGAAINQDKPIMALYTDARVEGIDIKLILDSGSAGSIIMKQLMDQLGCRVDHAATAWILTADENTKTPIGEIDNFPFEINGIQIPTKVLIMKATQYQALHARVPATCGHFKNQRTKEPLIEFEDTSMPPTIKTYQELAPTREEQEQRLANLNTKLCNHCLILCHFQYCDECDLMFNPPPRILFPITKLPEPKEEVLITKDMSFQDPTEDTKTEQYLAYPDLSKELELK
ncbi:hypothetical protein G9A89_012992 [Geosiphon pyriformis]|nr:hypothetical protein G9A89_012992 [Geosiphon pyriformis]